MTKIAIEKIVIDASLYPRSSVSDLHVHRLAAAIKTGTRLPPLVVEGGTRRLIDGRHRYEAHRVLKLKTIEVVEKKYKNEADLFADAVRLNTNHGEPLNPYSIRSAVIRLTTYGYTKEAISEVVRLPVEELQKIERGFASDEKGQPVALKSGLSYLRGTTLDAQQREINRRYSGPKALFFVRQIAGLLANDMYPQTATFAAEMDALCKLWSDVRAKSSAA